MQVINCMEIFTLADLEPRTDEHEKEYRRGYCDGFVSAANAIVDIWFLGKQKAYDVLFDHWEGSLSAWKRTEISNHMLFPPGLTEPHCIYCGEPAQHLDHLIPKSRGGSNDGSNLKPACARCNLAKGARTPEEWLAASTQEQIQRQREQIEALQGEQ